MSGIFYPLHQSVIHRLDPEYVHFYNEFLVNVKPVHEQPLHISRGGNAILQGGREPLPVGRKMDFMVDSKTTLGHKLPIRAFVPDGEPPSTTGWPSVLYLHGGGFVFGNIDTENTLCTHMCMRARCVVMTVDYRLAPEHPFPAAVDDSWEALQWLVEEGSKFLHLDLDKVAIGGSSAGANLAAVVAQRLVVRRLANFDRLVFQLLLVPVLDQTANVDSNPTWKEFEHTASLTAEKMTWYRNHYLPHAELCHNPEASPLLFQSEKFSCLPPALVIVAELDIVRHEGELYANKLKTAGVDAELHVIPGMPHPFLALDDALTAAREAITLLCDTLARAFDLR